MSAGPVGTRRGGAMLGVLVLVALTLTGCGGKGTGDKGYVAGDSGVIEYPVADRKPLGAVSGTTIDGKQISLKQLAHGRPAVINVWAEWCGPCRAESGELAAAANQLGSKAAFLGISIRPKSKANVSAFERTYKVGYPSLYDPDGSSLLTFPRGTVTQAIPSTVVVDSKGRVSASIIGPVPSKLTLVELVKSADSGPRTGAGS